MKDFTKENFLSFWPGGYQEDSNYLKPVTAIINRYGDKNGTALELGCGNGYWTTQYLVSRFKQVIALDVLSKPIMFKGTDVIYNELMSNDYTCANISDDSIDFIWSFGLFCHLSLEAQQEYLVNVFRVLKTGGKGVIMVKWLIKMLLTVGSIVTSTRHEI
jgi:SAM-dependent methyltransferase